MRSRFWTVFWCLFAPVVFVAAVVASEWMPAAVPLVTTFAALSFVATFLAAHAMLPPDQSLKPLADGLPMIVTGVLAMLVSAGGAHGHFRFHWGDEVTPEMAGNLTSAAAAFAAWAGVIGGSLSAALARLHGTGGAVAGSTQT